MAASLLLFLAVAASGQMSVDASKLAGTWEVVKGKQPPVGSTLEFTKDGKFKATIAGQPVTFEGDYKLEFDQLTLTPPGSAMTVTELTADKMVVEGKGNVMEYKRMATGVAAMPKAVTGRPGAQPKAAGKWAVVKSKDGAFTVEMPGPPNGREDGSDGDFETHGMSHQTRTLEYIANAIVGPDDVPQADQAKAIVRLRDQAISRYGKDAAIVYEKAVRSGELSGQEFEVKFDRMGAGPAVARGRVFISGKKSYVLLVMPVVKNQELPPEAGKFLESFALAGKTAAAPEAAKGRAPRGAARRAGTSKAGAGTSKAGAGTSKASANPLRSWGTEIDPDRDVRIAASGQSLTMLIPGTPHVLAPERGIMNAPRVVAPAHEDFVVSVRVDGAFQPGDRSTVKGLSSRQAAGLILWKDSGNYLVFQRRASAGDEGRDLNQAVLEELAGGSKGVTHRQAAPVGPLFLRLERKGGRISAAFSADGKDWKELKPVSTTWAEGEVQVGVIAVSTSAGPHKVTFGEYSLEEK